MYELNPTEYLYIETDATLTSICGKVKVNKSINWQKMVKTSVIGQ